MTDTITIALSEIQGVIRESLRLAFSNLGISPMDEYLADLAAFVAQKLYQARIVIEPGSPPAETWRVFWTGHENILRNLSERIAALEAVLKPSIHVLHGGLPICGFSTRPPGEWPPGHQWASYTDRARATCPWMQSGRESRDAMRQPINDYTPAERAEILTRMRAVSDTFYAGAARAGCHAFIEFCGLMNEFIKLCHEAERSGIDWLRADVHGGEHLPFAPHHIEYLNEKLECIYGMRFTIATPEGL